MKKTTKDKRIGYLLGSIIYVIEKILDFIRINYLFII
jgi:hypothetical protein